MQKTILPFCLLGLLFSIGSCNKEQEEVAPNSPDGIWVEQQARQDTLQFLDGKFLDLRRGRELSNGHLLPKYGAGLYSYQIKGDSISLRYTFSGSNQSRRFYFLATTATLTIGDFYANQARPQQLTFIRLK